MTSRILPSTLREFALITTSALDMAIQELSSNQPDLCLDTLTSLNGLLHELAGGAIAEQQNAKD